MLTAIKAVRESEQAEQQRRKEKREAAEKRAKDALRAFLEDPSLAEIFGCDDAACEVGQNTVAVPGIICGEDIAPDLRALGKGLKEGDEAAKSVAAFVPKKKVLYIQ